MKTKIDYIMDIVRHGINLTVEIPNPHQFKPNGLKWGEEFDEAINHLKNDDELNVDMEISSNVLIDDELEICTITIQQKQNF